MKHCKKGRQFGRVRRQRNALFRTLLGSLIQRGRIVTTEAKAKEINPMMDRLITKVKRAVASEAGGHEAIRKVERDIPLVFVKKLVADIDRFSDRNSGYTRVIKMAPRVSDNAKMAIIEFV